MIPKVIFKTKKQKKSPFDEISIQRQELEYFKSMAEVAIAAMRVQECTFQMLPKRIAAYIKAVTNIKYCVKQS